MVSTVNSEDFGEQGLRANLEDLRWLERIGRDHNRVVEAVAARAPMLPMGLATVYYNEDRVHAALAERADTYAEALDEIVG